MPDSGHISGSGSLDAREKGDGCTALRKSAEPSRIEESRTEDGERPDRSLHGELKLHAHVLHTMVYQLLCQRMGLYFRSVAYSEATFQQPC